MKKVAIALILVVVLILIIIGIGIVTGSQPTKGGVVYIGSDTARLSPGYTADINGVSLTFNELVADYRCAVNDDSCPEAGAVTTNVTLKSGYLTETKNLASDEIPYEFAGRRISIEKVSPDVRLAEKISKKDYRVTFRIRSPREEASTTDSDEVPMTDSDTDMETVTTRIDQGATALGVKVIPQELIDDSRCPLGTTCVWAGTVKIGVLISSVNQGSADQTLEFTLNQPQQFDEKTITLISVTPEKTESQIPLNQYQFTFKIEG